MGKPIQSIPLNSLTGARVVDMRSIEMSVILTIDFDIVMAPSIGLYNDIIGDKRVLIK